MNLQLLIFLSLFSFQTFGMGLEDCYQEALRRNENIGTQDEAVVQAHESVKQVYGSISPTVSFQSSHAWQEAPNNASPFYPTYQPNSGINATQPLLQGFREWEGLEKAKRTLSQQRYTTENLKLTTYKQVVAAYYGILNIERDIENLTENSKYLNDRIKELDRWHHIGRAQTTDVLLAKSNLAANEVQLEADRSMLSTARDQFTLLTGIPVDTRLDDDSLNFKPQLHSLKDYIDRISSRPDVAAAKDGTEAARNGINIAKANHLPSVSLNADWWWQRPAIQEGSNWDARIVFTMPIFAGGVTQSQVRQAYSVSRQAELQESLTKRSADEEIRSYYDMVASDLKQFQLNHENVDLSEANFKENLKSFRLGLVTNLDVLTALTNYITAKRTYDTNRFNLKAHFLSLDAAAALR